jgi:hypothetical protein
VWPQELPTVTGVYRLLPGLLGHINVSRLRAAQECGQQRLALAAGVVLLSVSRRRTIRLPRWRQINVIRADAKHLAEFAHLRNLGLATPAFPEVHRLWLNADRQGQVELRPSSLSSQLPDRLHRSARLGTDAFSRAAVIVQLHYNMC